ncbi:Pimeloyl-ACP methyl ester carboxylesterase [Klenkia marina]|uniref:Pimeloyl-ACP methyl ester carboxylesterase n=1 Tax=Klenkia marina TaxID=1960309 RepID=A0A1G4Z0J9_9ACTN|nr:alpha/beta fold hydrolase [Klenkia marina]SCX59204.1 Pimeloyl-ACP methyl ester carboxylesterase [Klenkia marina]
MSADLELSTRTIGDAGPRLAFVHGLFGQGRNWTTIARRLAEPADGGPGRRVTLVDLPNHGHSPWTDRVDYVDMAGAVADLLAGFGEQVTLVGHSMGGKVAMQVALRHPELLRGLVVVDISPSVYPETGGRTDDPDEEASPFAAFIAAMQAIDLDGLASREDADAALRAAVPSDMVRAFLLQSLVRDGAVGGGGAGGSRGWRWRLNLEVLGQDLGVLRGFPDPPPGAVFDGPVLWIAGADSTYVLDRDRPRMEELFPRVRLVRVKNAGHWVHSEAPEVFTEAVRRFLVQVGG